MLVITGPSGVGKGTVIQRLLEEIPDAQLAVSATTRAPRPGEVNGRDYHFLDETEFAARVEQGEFVEHAVYAGNHYGTLRSELERPARLVVLEIDLQGARQVAQAMPESVRVFIAPPDFGALEQRLRARASDSDEQITRRLAVAREELDAAGEFSRVVVNDDLDAAVSELVGIVGTMVDPEKDPET